MGRGEAARYFFPGPQFPPNNSWEMNFFHVTSSGLFVAKNSCKQKKPLASKKMKPDAFLGPKSR